MAWGALPIANESLTVQPLGAPCNAPVPNNGGNIRFDQDGTDFAAPASVFGDMVVGCAKATLNRQELKELERAVAVIACRLSASPPLPEAKSALRFRRSIHSLRLDPVSGLTRSEIRDSRPAT
jgi:hypothetical protein